MSPFAIPIGPISLSLCTLVLYMTPYILGWQRSALATLVFILLGVVGMPVFTGFQGGLGKVLGPTGGYIAGYIPLVIITGLAVQFFPKNRTFKRCFLSWFPYSSSAPHFNCKLTFNSVYNIPLLFVNYFFNQFTIFSKNLHELLIFPSAHFRFSMIIFYSNKRSTIKMRSG